MTNELKIVMAQLDLRLGDIPGNTQRIISAIDKANKHSQADVIIFPEMALCGYPPEDLLLRPEFIKKAANALAAVVAQTQAIHAVVGYPEWHDGRLYNSAAVIYNGRIIANYRKQQLPNYGVFDEKRYFTAGDSACIFTIKDFCIGINICEDLWQPDSMQQAKNLGANLLLCLNASPYHWQKNQQRLAHIRQRQQQEGALPVVYVNLVGGQDELVFDGASMFVDSQGQVSQQSPAFTESTEILTLIAKQQQVHIKAPYTCELSDDISTLYAALVLGTRDYIEKNNFPGVLIGLSGGIDSALTLAIACDAIGSERVEAVLMPSPYTAQMSIDDAIAEAEKLKVKYRIIPIDAIFNEYNQTLKPHFSDTTFDLTEENLQARCRGTLLMALANKFGKMVLTTSNKSEMAVGYATLYGDMVGGYAVLKDVIKTRVYALAKHRNQISPVIPQRVINREPSAELRPDQKDVDSLPPYDILDPIIIRYVEHNQRASEIINAGFAATLVHQVIRLIDRSEYKRNQAPPGVKVTARAFGRDWRLPMTVKLS